MLSLVISVLFYAAWCAPPLQATLSGLYVDNGDQTVMQRIISRGEKLDFEREMMNLLGLPRRPPRSHNSSMLESSAPKFLMDIYKSLDNSKSSRSLLFNEFNIGVEDLRSVKESDSIMTFLSHNERVSGVRHERGKRLFFDVSEVTAVSGDNIVGAHLRLFKNETTNVESGDHKVTFAVTLYQVLLDYNGGKELEYVDCTNTTYDSEGWLVFNVSGPFGSWISQPISNRGFYVSVHKNSKPVHELKPEDIGIVTDAGEIAAHKEKQPFMVAFMKSNRNVGHHSSHHKNTRSRSTRETTRRKKSESSEYNPTTNPFISASESAWTLRSCQIQTLYVNFKDLNWHEWIIAPDGYGAFYCSGMCDFPLNAHMNATNHAIVQTLVHLLDPLGAPRPCCAPTKLGSIAVLYYLEDNNVILKKYKNMIVKSCGCH